MLVHASSVAASAVQPGISDLTPKLSGILYLLTVLDEDSHRSPWYQRETRSFHIRSSSDNLISRLCQTLLSVLHHLFAGPPLGITFGRGRFRDLVSAAAVVTRLAAVHSLDSPRPLQRSPPRRPPRPRASSAASLLAAPGDHL
jgi:hypothetical protein